MTLNESYLRVYLMVTAVATTVLTHKQINKYYETPNRRLVRTHVATTTPSKIGCTVTCEHKDECHSVSFKRTTQECLLARVPLAGISEFAETNSDWVTLSKNVFGGVADIGPSIYESWMYGTSVTTTNEDCMRTDRINCTQHYHSTLVDDWDNLGVKLVRFAIYKGDQEVAYIIFDGVDSTYTSWFSTLRVVESTWQNLYNIHAKHFSIIGHEPRRFFICLEYRACPGDLIVIVVIDYQRWSCNYDNHATYPKLIYSTSNTWARPGLGTGINFADFMTVSIKIETGDIVYDNSK